MNKSLLVAALASSLIFTACMSNAPTYGNYLAEQDQATTVMEQQKLANDAVKQLNEVYAPAWTQFNLVQPVNDIFGLALIKSLRETGYAVKEYPKDPKANLTSSPSLQDDATDSKKDVSVQGASEYNLSYIFDRFEGRNEYRLTIFIGTSSLSRLYRLENGEFKPLGFWSNQS